MAARGPAPRRGSASTSTARRSSSATEMQCVILAGGLAHPAAAAHRDRPEGRCCRSPAGRSPTIQLALARARGRRPTSCFCIGHLGEQIRAHVGDGTRFGLRVALRRRGRRAARDRRARCGSPTTQGVLGQTRSPSSTATPTFRFDLRRRGRGVRGAVRPAALMTVFRNEGRFDARMRDSGGQGRSLRQDGRRSRGRRHASHRLRTLNHRSRRSSSPRWPLGRHRPRGRLPRAEHRRARSPAYEVGDRFYEIGSPAGLAALEEHLTAREEAR